MNSDEITYDLSLLDQSMQAWQRSPGLRLVYQSLYAEIAQHCRGSRILELGAGIGVSREWIPEVTTTDLVKTEYVDRAMSAYDLEAPEEGGAWSSIFAIDLLHHLREPRRFFESAARQLEPGGCIVLMEPAATALGRIFYKCFHHEPIVVSEVRQPFVFEANGADGEFANMGMGFGLFERNRGAIDSVLRDQGLFVRTIRYRDVLAYPLSGGYSKPQMLPSLFLRMLLRAESCLPQSILRWTGLRMIIVVERV